MKNQCIQENNFEQSSENLMIKISCYEKRLKTFLKIINL